MRLRLRLERVLVAVRDPQSPPQAAIAKALDLAPRAGVRVELFHAVADYIGANPVRGRDHEGATTRLMEDICAQRAAQLR
ncbi:MAG: hypothetical protein NZM12_04260, partial [Steroidobacteraceae bacterium]|nr:hypothetical protein [Steroidobacteraceae bacterium]